MAILDVASSPSSTSAMGFGFIIAIVVIVLAVCIGLIKIISTVKRNSVEPGRPEVAAKKENDSDKE